MSGYDSGYGGGYGNGYGQGYGYGNVNGNGNVNGYDNYDDRHRFRGGDARGRGRGRGRGRDRGRGRGGNSAYRGHYERYNDGPYYEGHQHQHYQSHQDYHGKPYSNMPQRRPTPAFHQDPHTNNDTEIKAVTKNESVKSIRGKDDENGRVQTSSRDDTPTLQIPLQIPINIPEIPREAVTGGRVKKKTLMKFKKSKPKKEKMLLKEGDGGAAVSVLEEPEDDLRLPAAGERESALQLKEEQSTQEMELEMEMDLDSVLSSIAINQQSEAAQRRTVQTQTQIQTAFDEDLREKLDRMDTETGRLIDDETNMILDKMIKSSKESGGGGSSNLKLPQHPVSKEPFLKKFYKESEIISNLSKAQVSRLRKNDSVTIRGKRTLKPVVEWNQLGFPLAISNILQKLNFQSPTPIQCEALPHIMDGRDFIGIAKTGSGKTISFLLPMFRQLFANGNRTAKSLGEDGEIYRGATPRALILTPTRELAIQIAKTAQPFANNLGMKIVKCYGGQSISAQIAELKSGSTDIIVGTPGRIIDLLCTNNGRILSLSEITYLVMDEADRMFDLGFEPQMIKILGRSRPDRQSVLFSATFPPKIQQIAREVLVDAVEVKIGDKNVVNENIHQHFEVVEKPEDKMRTLLNILGQYYDGGKNGSNGGKSHKILIFMEKQNGCDSMVKKLIGRGYAVMALHGGRDQAERDGTIKDFQKGIIDVIVATSIASRGLDVEGLNLVINYDAPSHIEDYVHRVGRTGRAGKSGDAFTIFVKGREAEEKLAYEMNRVMKDSLSEEVIAMAETYSGKLDRNEAKYAGYGGGFSGKGLEKLRIAREQAESVERAVYLGEGNPVAGDDDEGDGNGEGGGDSGSDAGKDLLGLGNVAVVASENGIYSATVPLQTLPQAARWWAASHETTAAIAEQTHCMLAVRGTYGSTEEPLHMAVTGAAAVDVERAVRELVAGVRSKLAV